MSTKNIATRAFCLHSRPYRECSMIVQLFTEEHGKLSAIIKGVKTKSRKNGTLLPLLQPFIPLRLCLTGKSELKSIVDLEISGKPFVLSGPILFAGLYVNELLMRLMPEHIEYLELYQQYRQLLESLQSLGTSVLGLEPPLRIFEKSLMDNLGYGVPFVEVDAAGRQLGLLENGVSYHFVPEAGFVRCADQALFDKGRTVFLGQHLLKIACDELQQPDVILQAKYLMRMVIAQHLGNKPLNSKLLFS